MSNTLFKKVTATAAALSIVLSIVSPVVGVKAADASVEAANRLAALGVIVDSSANPSAYNLGSNITRREMLKVMMNLSSVEVTDTCEGKFSDLPKSDWGCKYAEAALKAGFIAANPKFRPNDLVTEAEALKMVMQARGVAKTEGIADWAQAYADAAVKAGIVAAGTKVSATGAAKRSMVFVSADSAVTNTTGETSEDSGEDDLGGLFDDLFGEDDGTDMSTGTTSTGTTSTGTTTPTTKAGELEVSLNPESPTGNVAAGAARTAVLAFDVTAGKEDLTLKEATVKFTGLGDADTMDDLAVYLGNTKVSKQSGKNFDDDNEAILTFEKNFVVKAGETQKLVVTTSVSTGAALTNQTLRVSLVDLVSSAASLKGLPVAGAALTPVSVTNKAVVEIDADTASETVTVGKSVKLAGFELEETSNKEDVVVKAVTFTVSGSIDSEEDLSDLVLYADGKEVAADLEVNGDEEIVADLDYTIAADDKVKFELKGTVTGSIGETIELVFDDPDDVFVVGKTTGISLNIADVVTTDLAASKTIEGSEINVSFDKSDVDEAKPNADAVLLGTVKFSATNEYTIDELQVTVTGTGTPSNVIKTLELDGSAYDRVSGNVYTFEDISLTAGQSVSLPLTMDVVDNTALNGTTLTFSVKVAKVTDEENDETYTTTTALNNVLSSNSFNSKTIDIESATFTLTQTAVSDKELVLGNGVEVVLYKGKVSVGDADSVLVNDMTFTTQLTTTGSYNLQDIVDSAVLNIGGKTYSADVETTGLDFTSISHKLDAGVDNVELTLTARLKDNDSVNNNDVLKASLTEANIDLEDSDGEALVAANVDVVPVSGADDNQVTLNEQGSLTVKVINSGDYKDEVKSVVLAGASNVALAEVSFEAEDEDVKVKELTLTVAGDFSSTVKNVKLVNAATKATIVDGATVTYTAGSGTIVKFKNDFVLADASNEVKALLVADLEKFTDKGGSVSARTGDMVVSFSAVEATGVASNEDIVGGFLTASGSGETVTVVPALVTVSIVDEIGANDKDAVIRFAVDKGNNDFTDDSVYFTGMVLESAVASGVVIRNDDDAALNLSGASSTGITVANTLVDTEIVNGDEYTIKVENDGDEVRVVARGIKYTIGAGSTVYSVVNDKVINLGEYDAD